MTRKRFAYLVRDIFDDTEGWDEVEIDYEQIDAQNGPKYEKVLLKVFSPTEECYIAFFGFYDWWAMDIRDFICCPNRKIVEDYYNSYNFQEMEERD